MMIAGFGFKASAAPFHMWTPDVYEGAPTPVTAFMAAATKVAALVVTLRVLATAFPQEARLWTIAVAAIACASLAIGAARERELQRPVTLENLAGFGWERPLLGIAMWTFMLGFAGLPLTGGFVGKFYVFSAAYEHGWIWLVIVGVAATAVSLYYYLGIIRAMYMRPTEELQLATVVGGSPPPERLLQAAVAAALVVTVGSFFAVQPLIDGAKHAAAAIF